MINCLLFAMALFSTVSIYPEARPVGVPLDLGLALCLAAEAHADDFALLVPDATTQHSDPPVNATTVGATYLAENKSEVRSRRKPTSSRGPRWRRYSQRGRYGANPREEGVVQLVDEERIEAFERCSCPFPDELSDRHRAYCLDRGDRYINRPFARCRYIAPGEHPDASNPRQAFEVLAITLNYYRARHDENRRRRRSRRWWKHAQPFSYLVQFRCAPSAWQNRPRFEHGKDWDKAGASKDCYKSVGRVLKYGAHILQAKGERSWTEYESRVRSRPRSRRRQAGSCSEATMTADALCSER